MWRLLLVLGSWSVTVLGNGAKQTNTSERYEEFCPSRAACRALFPVEMSNRFTPCCKDCTCDDTCPSIDNCCLRDPGERTLPENIECTSPNLGLDFDTARLHKWYLMVTESSDASSSNPDNTLTSNRTERCGDKAVAWWGSLLPVYSPGRQLIYKNPICAEEDGVTDGSQWMVYLECGILETSQYKTFPSVHGFDALPSHCQLYFEPPNGIAHGLDSMTCFDQVNRKCKDNFTLSTDVNMTTEQVRRSCESGYFVPTIYGRSKEIYANTFCIICNAYEIESVRNCRPTMKHESRSHNVLTLLSTERLDVHREAAQKASRPLACNCLKGQAGLHCCRVVRCPTGHEWDLSGKCALFLKELTGSHIGLSLTLKTRQSIDKRKLFTIHNKKGQDSWLKSPWRSHVWETVKIFVKDTDCTSDEASFSCEDIIVRIRHKHKTVHVERLFLDIKSILPKSWKICLDKKCEQVSQSFARIFQFRDISENTSIPTWYARSKLKYSSTNSEGGVLYHKIYDLSTFDTGIAVRKTFLCRQIALKQIEYEMEWNKMIVSNEISGRVFYDNEFDMTMGTNGERTPTICLEDSHFEVKDVSGCGVRSFQYHMKLTIIVHDYFMYLIHILMYTCLTVISTY